jgi:hypothetical protein
LHCSPQLSQLVRSRNVTVVPSGVNAAWCATTGSFTPLHASIGSITSWKPDETTTGSMNRS